MTSTPNSHLSAFDPDTSITSNQFISSDDRRPARDALLEASRSQSILTSYLLGQLANVAKAALWWSVFGTLVLSMLPQHDAAVGLARISFNAALVAVSPIAGVIAERAAVHPNSSTFGGIRAMLIGTTLGRMLVWSVLVPIAWIFLENFSNMRRLFYGLFVCLMFLDGLQVAFANVVDLDCGGLDVLANEQNLSLSDFLRIRFNSLHQLTFDCAFVVFTSPLALLFVAINYLFVPSWGSDSNTERYLGPANGAAVLVLGISASIALLSMFSLFFYVRGIPRRFVIRHPPDVWATQTRQSLWKATRERVRDIVEGATMVRCDSALKWRLAFLAMETALEDSMVSVVIPEIALNSPEMFGLSGNRTVCNFWAVTLIAVGKAGGVAASSLFNSFGLFSSINVPLVGRGTDGSPPTSERQHRRYRGLFLCVFLASLSLVILPLARIPLHHLEQASLVFHPRWGAGVLTFLAVFLFFVFSSAPKIGFAALLQHLVHSHALEPTGEIPQFDSAKVFGFIGSFVTIVDGLVICAISLVFTIARHKAESHELDIALWVVVAIYLLHGILEVILGPCLVLDANRPPR